MATRLIVEEALEGEAGDAVGRDYYERQYRLFYPPKRAIGDLFE